MKLDRRSYQYKRVASSQPADSKSIAEDLEVYQQYYSDDCKPCLSFRVLNRYRLPAVAVAFVLLFIFLSYRSPDRSVEIMKPVPKEKDIHASSPLPHTPMRSLGAKLSCDPAQLKPSATVPDDVNKVRPADIVSIAAMGDSITGAAGSKDFQDEERDYFFKNSFVTGGAEGLDRHITLANVLRQFNPELHGCSTGVGYDHHTGFNVAVGGMTCEDLPRQAEDLISRLKAEKVDDKWKLINIFIGTNDIGNLSCYKTVPFIPPTLYKSLLEKSISFLKQSLPNTIVSITSMWNSQLSIEAGSLITTGERKTCFDGVIEKRDEICTAYRNAAYEIQNEKKFESKQFTVVVQGFMDDIRDAFRNKSGAYDTSFYADDIFHLSKYGNAILGKFLWNGLLEPVGKKNTKAELNNDDVPLTCPNKDVPFIRTMGNS